MPELPEVETTRKGMLPHVLNQTVAHVVIRQPKLRWPIPHDLPQQLIGQSICAIERRGKYLLLMTKQGTLLMHLGMSGSIRVIHNTTKVALGSHDHVDIIFTNHTLIRFTDPRRFGAILWHRGDVAHHPLLQHLGPEPLSDAFDGHYLYQRSRKRTVSIKSFIMNARIVVGVGNIYANEALFLAGINPKRIASRISLARTIKLAETIKHVLQRAITCGGTTLKDFMGSNGKPGYFHIELSIYGKAGEPCSLCGNPICIERMHGRSTFFCRHCQT